MKRALFFAIFSFFICTANAQTFSRVTFTRDGNLDFLSISLDGNVLLFLDKDGSIKKWGYDRFGARGQDNYSDELDPYVGRVDYYTQNDDPAFRGKIKYIGSYQLTYYASYDQEYLRGKLKSIGSISFDYYTSFDDNAFRGNIKSIGQNSVTWYSSFDNAGSRGKLKSIGNTQLTYYNLTDDKIYGGRVKSIGGTSYAWYGSFDRKDYQGGLKTGSSVQTINQVKYFVR